MPCLVGSSLWLVGLPTPSLPPSLDSKMSSPGSEPFPKPTPAPSQSSLGPTIFTNRLPFAHQGSMAGERVLRIAELLGVTKICGLTGERNRAKKCFSEFVKEVDQMAGEDMNEDMNE